MMDYEQGYAFRFSKDQAVDFISRTRNKYEKLSDLEGNAITESSSDVITVCDPTQHIKNVMSSG